MREYLPYMMALLIGVFTALEVGINTKLGTIVSPRIATLHSLIVGVAFFLFLNAWRGTLHMYRNVFHANPVWLIGGIFGALIIYLSTKTVPRLGIATTLILAVSAEVLLGLFIDSFIIRAQAFNIAKMLGLAFLLVGIYILVD